MNDEGTMSSERVFVEYLSWIKDQATQNIKKEIRPRSKFGRSKVEWRENEIKWVMSVPAIWSDKTRKSIKDWVTKAGLFIGSLNQFQIVSESHCIALSVHHMSFANRQQTMDLKIDESEETCTHSSGLRMDVNLCQGDKYMIVDVGRATCDVICHEVVGEFAVVNLLHESGTVL